MALKFLNNGYFAGKVGIGTDSPSSNLDIEDASGVTIDINSSSGDGMFRFQDDGTTKWAIGRDNTQQNFVFSNSAGLASDNVLTLAHSTGNVGIGTTSPGEKLEVDGIIKVVHTDNSYANYRGHGVFFNRTENYIAPLADNTSTLNIGYNGAKWGNIEINGAFIKFENGPNEFMRISSSGNVGIGTTSPNAKLDIVGGGISTSPTLELNSSTSSTFNHAINAFNSNLTTGENQIIVVGKEGSAKNSGYIGYKWIGDGSNDNLVTIGHWASDNLVNIDALGNVGIGTTSPSRKLHVNAGADNEAVRIESSDTEVAIELKDTTGTATIRSRGDFRFDGSSGEIMRMESGGNVGIGTTSPDSLLHVAADVSGANVGTITIEGRPHGFLGDDIATIDFHNNGTKLADIRMERGNASNDSQIVISTSDAGTLNDALIINEVGNVGIGTTSPSTKGHFYSATSMDQLTVDGIGAIETGINFASGGTTYGQIYFNNVSPYDMSVLQQYSTGSLIFGTNDTERMRITSAGNVGIGTTSPTRKLQVEGGDFYTNDKSDTIGANVGYGGNSFQIRNGSTSEDLNFDIFNRTTSTWGTPFVIKNTGNIGIGTTSPNANLVVRGSGLVSQDFFHIEDSGGVRMLEVTSDAAGNSNLQVKDTAGATKSLINSAGNSYLNGGNVGIGTTSPAYNLQLASASSTTMSVIADAATSASVYFGDSASATQGRISYNNANDSFLFFTDATERMRINSSGNVGIGTTTPSKALHVSDSNDAPFRVESTDSTTGIQFKDPDGNNNIYYVGNGDYFYTSANVGIGTTSPQSKLQVAGGIQMADDTDTASAAKVGTMRYRTGTEYVEVTGTEMVTNGDFATDTDWSKNSGVTISGGTMNFTSTPGHYGSQNINFTNGAKYKINFEITAETSGALTVFLGAGNNVGSISGVGKKEIIATGNSSLDTKVYFGNNFTGSIDNVSVIEVTAEDASYADMCMQTGSSTYEWVNIVRNTY